MGLLYLGLLLGNRVGVGADTVIYYAAAQNLLDGQGLTLPFSSTFAGDAGELMTHFPPFYPALLALLGWLFSGVAAGALILSIVSFGCLILVVGWIMLTNCPDQPWLAVVAAFLTLTSGAIIRLHTVALSEPIFILCWLLGFFILARYLQKQQLKFLLLAALLLSISFLTRFAGLAFIATACLWLYYRRGWQTAVTFGLLAILPMASWLVYGSVVGSATNRIIAVHWIASHHLWQGLYTVSAWVSPDSLPPLLRLVLWLVLLVGLAWMILKRQFAFQNGQNPFPDLFKLLLLGAVIYAAQIVLSISFLDVQVRLSPRILAPIYFSLMLTLLYGVSVWWPGAASAGRRVVTAVGGVICLAYFVGALYTFSDIQQVGEHYTGVAWRDSETLAYLQTVDGRTSFVTNGPDLIYYYTGLPVADIPAQYQDTSLLPNAQYDQEMESLRQELRSGTQLVYLHNMQWRWFLPSQETVNNTLPLRAIAQFDDGTIYVWDGE